MPTTLQNRSLPECHPYSRLAISISDLLFIYSSSCFKEAPLKGNQLTFCPSSSGIHSSTIGVRMLKTNC